MRTSICHEVMGPGAMILVFWMLSFKPTLSLSSFTFKDIISWKIDGETMETVTDFILGGSKITADGDYSHEIKTHLLLGRKSMTNLDGILKSRDITLPTKVHLVKAMIFSVVVYVCESWTVKKTEAPKNQCFWTVVLEKTLESPLDYKEIQPVHPKGNQSWMFIGRTDGEAESLILWPPDVKNWLVGKDPDAGKDWRWEERGMTEDGMVGLHHWELVMSQWTQWSPLGHKESDMTEQLNWTELMSIFFFFLTSDRIYPGKRQRKTEEQGRWAKYFVSWEVTP